MSKYEIFSKRQKRLRGEVPDVYDYDSIPSELRVQVIHIWGDTLGHCRPEFTIRSENIYSMIHDILCREYGRFSLGNTPYENAEKRLKNRGRKPGTDRTLTHLPSLENQLNPLEVTESGKVGPCRSRC